MASAEFVDLTAWSEEAGTIRISEIVRWNQTDLRRDDAHFQRGFADATRVWLRGCAEPVVIYTLRSLSPRPFSAALKTLLQSVTSGAALKYVDLFEWSDEAGIIRVADIVHWNQKTEQRGDTGNVDNVTRIWLSGHADPVKIVFESVQKAHDIRTYLSKATPALPQS